MTRYGPRALILGGSEGIGAGFAERLASQGFDLTLVARTQVTLDAKAAELREHHAVQVDTEGLDLARPEAVERVAAVIDRHAFDLVIYNAGATHGAGLFLDRPLQHALELVALDCATPVAVAHRALQPMRVRGRGGFILVSSMSGLVGAGYVAAYAAAKAFEIALAQGLYWEMKRSGVDVLCAVATLTDTPAMARSGVILHADSRYPPMAPDAVAYGALEHLGRGPLWYAVGEDVARTLMAQPQREAIDQMSRASAALYGIVV
ncbi:MAG TPA: SDR family NAD(P)-dependent oxidoreductase [Nevskiaceae bacterium]|nr:SDR family NAD(P)-dependent oxidoreductase [Nevskiaceae bacterium]